MIYRAKSPSDFEMRSRKTESPGFDLQILPRVQTHSTPDWLDAPSVAWGILWINELRGHFLGNPGRLVGTKAERWGPRAVGNKRHEGTEKKAERVASRIANQCPKQKRLCSSMNGACQRKTPTTPI